ncbi:MAG: hypothetical protein AAF288_10515 [Planctomycetota bacterium]
MTKRPGRLLETIRTLALGAWLGLFVCLGVTAAAAFGMLRSVEGLSVNDDALAQGAEGASRTTFNLDTELNNDISADLAANWIAGGVVSRTIEVVLAVQLGLGTLALGMMVFESTPKFARMLRCMPGSPANVARIALVAVALGLTGYLKLGLLPAMNELRPQAYSIRPDLPDKGAALRAAALAEFDPMHRRSNQLFSIAAACIVLGAIATPYAFAPPPGGTPAPGSTPAPIARDPGSEAFSRPEGSA